MTQKNGAFEKVVKIDKVDPLLLYGLNDENLKLVERHFPVQLIARGNTLKIKGEQDTIDQVGHLLNEMIFIVNRSNRLSLDDIETLVHILKSEQPVESDQHSDAFRGENVDLDEVIIYTRTGFVKPRTSGHRKMMLGIREHDIVVIIGPAGTGKTYVAVSLAVAALKAKQVKKIVLARPAVEAGENLGYLPGDYKEKIDPYLRPLYDALEDMLPRELIRKYTEQGIIEVIPLAFMRGRTLNSAFVILDEAQNATAGQMKMFLTRLGVNSKAMVNGDVTQVDLPDDATSGLLEIQEVLSGVDGIEFIYMDRGDVVRHRLVRDIINAYDQHRKSDNQED